jgi:endogenous inhibitor of DNA gyrase (YacG/DUF329 family)
MIDLKRWLNEEYGLPHVDPEADETETNGDSA